jgi:hypothetical protein
MVWRIGFLVSSLVLFENYNYGLRPLLWFLRIVCQLAKYVTFIHASSFIQKWRTLQHEKYLNLLLSLKPSLGDLILLKVQCHQAPYVQRQHFQVFGRTSLGRRSERQKKNHIGWQFCWVVNSMSIITITCCATLNNTNVIYETYNFKTYWIFVNSY